MKKLFYATAIVVCMLFLACNQDNENAHEHAHEIYSQESLDIEYQHIDTSEYVQGTRNDVKIEKDILAAVSLGNEQFSLSSQNPIYYQVSPNGGQCGATQYLFVVKDFGAPEEMQVKLYLPNNHTVYQDMYRWGEYQYVYLTSYVCGDIFWKYVLKQNYQGLISTQKLKNTGVDIRVNGLSKIGWTFNDDGSSWQIPAGWWQIFGSQFHQNLDAHAQDWNWGSGNQDLGKVMRAPLCGKVVSAGWTGSCYGNVIDIEHYTGTDVVMYRVAHLDGVDVQTGQFISRNTKIGTVGNSGSSTCSGSSWTAHAHSVLYKLDANLSIDKGLAFEFSYGVYRRRSFLLLGFFFILTPSPSPSERGARSFYISPSNSNCICLQHQYFKSIGRTQRFGIILV